MKSKHLLEYSHYEMMSTVGIQSVSIKNQESYCVVII